MDTTEAGAREMVRAEAAERRRARETQTRTNQPKNTEAAAQRQSNKTKTKTKKSRLLYGCAGARSLFSQYPGIKAHSAPALLDSQSPASSSAADKRRSAQRGVSSSLLPLLSSHPSPQPRSHPAALWLCVLCVLLCPTRAFPYLIVIIPTTPSTSSSIMASARARLGVLSDDNHTTSQHNPCLEYQDEYIKCRYRTVAHPLLRDRCQYQRAVARKCERYAAPRLFFLPPSSALRNKRRRRSWLRESRSRIGVRCAEE